MINRSLLAKNSVFFILQFFLKRCSHRIYGVKNYVQARKSGNKKLQ